MKIPHFPKVIRIEPASQCNLMCSHCPTGTIDMNRGIMDHQVFEKILGEIKRYKDYVKVIVLYHGGEPLLNKKMFDMIEQLKKFKSDLFIKTVSNGMALNEKNSDKILNSNLDLIEFSLDGNSAKESEEIRIGSKTDKILSNIYYLLKKRDLKKSKLKVEITTTQFFDPKKPKKKPTAPNWLKKVFENFNVGFKPTFAYLWPHIDLKNKYSIFHQDNGEKNYCDHIINTISIRANGDVVACCYDLTSKLVTGNINKNSIKNIWDGQKYLILRSQIENNTPPKICSKCSVIRPNYYILKN